MSKKIDPIKTLAQDLYMEKVLSGYESKPDDWYIVFFWANDSELKHLSFPWRKDARLFIVNSKRSKHYGPQNIEIFRYIHQNQAVSRRLAVPGIYMTGEEMNNEVIIQDPST